MRRVRIEDLKPGMMVGRTIFDAGGRPLLTQNTLLTNAYIERLHSLGLGSVYIKDSLADCDIPEIVSQQVLNSVRTTLKTSITNFNTGRSLDMENLRKGVSLLLDDIMTNRNLLIHIEDICTYSDYILFHSINVAILSLMTGLQLGYMEGNLMDLGLGALLHDIGMIIIDPAIVNKEGDLSPLEKKMIAQHPETGFNILRSHKEISTTAAHIAYQHHERFNGTGYPRQLSRKQIVDYAKIAAIADTYDAVTADRPYRRGYSCTDAVFILKKLSGQYFEPGMVDAFISNVAIYPIGCMLLLNTGHIGLVTSVTKINTTRPVIHVVSDSNGLIIKPPYQIDLQKTNDVKVVRRLSIEEADQTRAQLLASKASSQTG